LVRLRTAVVAGVLAASCATVAWASDTFAGFPVVRVLLNNQEVVSDVPAVVIEGRTMLPVRKMAELAGLTVDKWDPETNTVYLSSSDKVAALQAENARLKAQLAQMQLAGAVATVNGEPITQLDLYSRMLPAYGAITVDDLIYEKLVDQAAAKAGVAVSAAEVDTELAKVVERVGGQQRFEQALVQNNLTVDGLRQNLSVQVKIRKTLSLGLSVTDADVRAFYDENPARFDRRQVHARHILVATEEEARAIKAELDKGADFAALAKAESTEPAARQSGGDLGFFGVGVMVPEFEQVVFGLKVGVVSEPFETAFGWHVAQVLEAQGTAPDFEALKAEVREAYIASQVEARVQPWLVELRERAEVTNTLE
jgi:foldase protein PrsA